MGGIERIVEMYTIQSRALGGACSSGLDARGSGDGNCAAHPVMAGCYLLYSMGVKSAGIPAFLVRDRSQVAEAI